MKIIAGNPALISLLPSAIVIRASRNLAPELVSDCKHLLSSITEIPLIFAGGWQSPFENFCLEFLHHSSPYHSFLYFVAKNIIGEKLLHLKQIRKLSLNRCVFINPDLTTKKLTKDNIKKRDKFIVSHLSHFLFLYIQPEGWNHHLFQACVKEKKNIYVLNHPVNEAYFWDSVTLVDPWSVDIFRCLSIL